MSEKYEPGQFVPINEYQAEFSGGPTPSGTASSTWPLQAAPAPYRHCPTCTCGQQHYYPYYTPYDPYYRPAPPPWEQPWTLYTNL